MIATYHSLQSHKFSAKFYYQLLKKCAQLYIAQYISLQRQPNICLKSLRKLVLHLYMNVQLWSARNQYY